jgi:DNA ligase-1
MMRQPGSNYEIGRSWTLRKVKTFHDAEARVTAHVRGAGRHDGRLGSLQCEMPDGTVFNVGTGLSDAERNAPPPIGSIVTYRYQELSNDGVPRFPSYIGVRHDLPWPPPDAPVRSRAVALAPAPAASAAIEVYRRSFVRGVTTWSIELDGRTVKTSDEQPGEAAETTTRRNTSPAGAWRGGLRPG